MSQPGLFDLSERHKKLNEKDPLTHLNALIDWESFRPVLNQLRSKKKKKAGRPSYDLVMMFKILVLQSLYNVSDDEIEYQIRDRYSFCRFLGLMPEDKVPDAKTVWLFREKLTVAGLIKEVFHDFDIQLQSKGFVARKGQIVDASFVEAPKQRNTGEENALIKSGEIPDSFLDNPNKAQQKDTDARWAKKNNEVHFGYKNHIAIDNQHKMVREFEVTSAEVHDSNVFMELLTENSTADVWADSAYYSDDSEIGLYASGYRSHVHKKGKRNKPMSEKQQEINTRKSRIRARVEHVFGSIHNEQGGLMVRAIGLARAKTKIGLMNLVYNMRRCVSLSRISASIA